MYTNVTEIPELFLRTAPEDRFIGPLHLARGAEDIFLNSGLLSFLGRTAKEAANAALSWRHFKVGAMLLAWSTETHSLGLVTGTNVKQREDDDGLNIHAETMALAKARRHSLDQALALMVWGEPQSDQQSGKLSRTLHPCGLCRNMLNTAPEITPQTLLVSSNQDFTVCELFTIDELQTYHASGEVEGAEPLNFSLADNQLSDEVYDTSLSITLAAKWRQLHPGHPSAWPHQS